MLEIWYWMIVILAIATMVIGNLFALRQQNIKRFLAFSSIAQVGFILVGISNADYPNCFGSLLCIDLCIFQLWLLSEWLQSLQRKQAKKILMITKDCTRPILS